MRTWQRNEAGRRSSEAMLAPSALAEAAERTGMPCAAMAALSARGQCRQDSAALRRARARTPNRVVRSTVRGGPAKCRRDRQAKKPEARLLHSAVGDATQFESRQR